MSLKDRGKISLVVLHVISYDKLCSNMKIIISLLFAFISASGHAFSCYDPQTIIQKPIQFDKKRIALTREYQLTHYGIDSESIEIEPKMIVLHWTCIPSLDTTFRIFNPPLYPAVHQDEMNCPGI